MKCPHCLVEINPDYQEYFLGKDIEGDWSVFKMTCPNPECKKFIIRIAKGTQKSGYQCKLPNIEKINEDRLVRPITSSRPPVAKEVEVMFSSDYNEACLVLGFSPKSSAALSRRCLQNLLREKAGVKKGDLAREIQEVIDSKSLPTYLAENIDAIRNIGNFAAHPQKSTATGEIIDIEPGEAEWLLDVLEMLFDFYFVQPALAKAKRDALNIKLQEAGKPAMK
ncbi:MAG: DUF4145 domain-containing protein [Paludibacter sp.]|nr:DUF4145 domain-containing protein [Paludibacter sp.]